jgi:hypothetical protein
MRRFLAVLFLTFLVIQMNTAAEENSIRTEANVPVEITLTAQQPHEDPFNTVTLDVVFTDGAGATQRVPAFWAGGATWKVRYASPTVGVYRWRSECNDTKDAGLHGVADQLEVQAYGGQNALIKHGPIRVAADKRHFEHVDGTPFFWLGDTWWMGLCTRLHWPDEFQKLAADRVAKGFNVVQIVAGLYPDMPAFDPRGANEAGFPWEKDYARIRPEYFDAADTRLKYLVDQGITPCIVGAWGYFLPWMGIEKAKQHWRYLVARYGAYPVVWCVAGEANLPYYLAKGFPYDDREAVKGWTEVARYLRATDPFHRVTTIHPTGLGPLNARHAIDDVSLIDFDMLQTPHGQREAVVPTLKAFVNSYTSKPVMPSLNGEPCYEMLFDKIEPDWPRAVFWICMMNGAAGHTYGANGIWQCNRKDQPHGKSPNGGFYGVITWDDAMNLAGSKQLGLGKKFLSELPWTKLTPLPGAAQWSDQPTWGDWIWSNEGDPKTDAPVEPRFFRRSFELPAGAAVRNAVLKISADDAFTVWLNGTEIGSGEKWDSPGRFDVSKSLKAGTNVLAVRAENKPAPVKENPAGLIVSLEIDSAGQRVSIRSDALWHVEKKEMEGWRDAGFDDKQWARAMVTAPYGQAPWGRFEKTDDTIDPLAMGLGDRLRVFYAIAAKPVSVRGLPPETKLRLTYFDPVTGERTKPIDVQTDAGGNMQCPAPAYNHDWVGMLER